MTRMKLITRPMVDRSWIGTQPRRGSQFTATWSSTLDLLEHEVYSLQRVGMADPVLMMDITEADLRLDGQVRANARPATNAVALSFDSIRGPLTFRCDRYEGTPYGNKMKVWQHNVRAIALSLEALRSVDRYGATSTGEQYAGWRQLPAPEPRQQSVTGVTEARRYLRLQFGDQVPYSATDRDLVRVARRESHPDRPGGSRVVWDRVEECARLLGVQP